MTLPELKKIAEAAPCGSMQVGTYCEKGIVSFFLFEESTGRKIAKIFSTGDKEAEENEANRIAAFNRQTVLRLIETLEIYEKALKNIQDYPSKGGHSDGIAREALAEGAKILKGEEK